PPVDERHHQVEEDDVGDDLIEQVERGAPVRGDVGDVTLELEVEADDPHEVRLVLDHEDRTGGLGRFRRLHGRSYAVPNPLIRTLPGDDTRPRTWPSCPDSRA